MSALLSAWGFKAEIFNEHRQRTKRALCLAAHVYVAKSLQSLNSAPLLCVSDFVKSTRA